MDPKKFDKLIIWYFSGTGNASQVARWIIEYAESKNIKTQLINIAKHEQSTNIEITKKTIIGFCYPTHGFNAPPIILKFITRFPRAVHGNKFFVLNTRAGMKISKLFAPGLSGLALLLPALMMIIKGYKLFGYRSIDLPSNWISIHPGLKEKVVFSIFVRCKRITLNFSRKILSGKKIFRGLWELPVDLAISPVSMGYYFFGRFMLSKTFIATNACNQCWICVENCPVNAIKIIDDKPYWTYRCESCMQCMNNCKQRAIETPHGLVIPIWWFALSILPLIILKFISNYTNAENLTKGLIYYILYIILSFSLVFGSYKIVHKLMKFKFFNKIIKYTSLTTYRFWRRYKAPKNVNKT
ncbi:MAG: EFR1 family ferrodoxin [Bacteroidales bacterium]|nr:EFR1 family ferrodoxin [Bacteroidales bacterium]